MLKLGEKQNLIIAKTVEFGVYLAESMEAAETERVLLPVKQVPAEKRQGDSVEVFLYKDSEDRLIATTRIPQLTLHETAVLRVRQTGKFGAFLDWGLEKDLMLPFKEQTRRVKEGDECLVALYIDKSKRLCATMKVYHYLHEISAYKKGDRVTGVIYEISDNFGAFVAVDQKYSGLIVKKEMYGNLQVGDRIQARVLGVHEDGKLDLSVREKAYLQIGVDSEKLLEKIESYDGVFPFNDKAAPEVILRETGMSKNEFKRAVGHLLKTGRIEIGTKCIRRIHEQ